MKESISALSTLFLTFLLIGSAHAGAPLTCAQRQAPVVQLLQSIVNLGEQACVVALKGHGCDPSACDVEAPDIALPATGQTTSVEAGDDGAVKAGAPLSYKNNGDGTVTDNNTRLMWETKDEDSSDALHYRGNDYPWTGMCQDNSTVCSTDADCSSVAGTAKCTTSNGAKYTIFQWVAQLNLAAFAGHTDWRIPNVKELENLVDYGASQPSVLNSAFNNNCSPGCTFTSCSCTSTDFNWSSTTNAAGSNDAWGVDFGSGLVFANGKTNNGSVRAVRGGH